MIAANQGTGSAALATALLLGAVASIGLMAVERDRLRRVLLGLIDPRPLALLRICFGLCLLLGALEVAPLNLYLFSDEGLVPSPAVAQLHGRAALAGHGPAGFTDARAILDFVASGRWSLLFFWDSPEFVRAYFAAFVTACALFIIGWRTRATSVITWLLYIGMLRRGDAHWAGEQVYCAFMFLLVLARCGEALSVDNVLRCRRLRARGQLSEPGGAGEGAGAPPGPAHPQGLAAIYRRVPTWPQALMVLQLAICFAVNGWAKWGKHWVTGDALLYTLHLDSVARADWHALVLGLGPWPVRIGALTVLWWERLFPLLLVGLWLRASASLPAPTGSARALARGCWLALAAALAIAALSGDMFEKPDDPSTPMRSLTLGLLAAVIAAVTLAGSRVPRGWLLRWGLAPRLWLGFGALFHVGNFILLNVGVFNIATFTVFLVCGAGPGAVRVVQASARGLARIGVPVPKHMLSKRPIAAEDRDLPRLPRDAASLPGWALAGAGGVLLLAGVVAVVHGPKWWHGAWLLVAAGLVVVGRRRARDAPISVQGPPWAYGPAGRLAAGGVFTYHLVALLLWQLPRWPAFPYREPVRSLVAPWMEATSTKQGWSMFAPNPPRRNVTLRTRIIDAAGVEHDLRTELQHSLAQTRPALWTDRWRKIESGQRAELLPWHARWWCRRWALERGELPREVVLEQVSAPIDPLAPALVDFWARARVEPLVRVTCASEPFAQLDDELRARHGLPPAAPGSLHYTWPESQVPDPLAPLWLLLALGLTGGLALSARDDRRRHAALRA